MSSVISNLNLIGFNCIVISLSAIAFSVIFTIIVEKTILPLDEISKEIRLENINISEEIDLPEEENKKFASALAYAYQHHYRGSNWLLCNA